MTCHPERSEGSAFLRAVAPPAIVNRPSSIVNPRVLAGLVVLLWLAASALGVSEPIQYQLDLRNPASHQVEIEMTVSGASPATEFQIPAWNNLYQIRDFARTVSDVTAECDGRTGTLARVDLDTWRSESKSCAKLTVRYNAYVSGPTPFSSDVDGTHAFLNFATLLFYLPKERERAVHVKLLLPEGWKAASLLDEDANGFSAPNYDLLVDSPAEAGQFQEYSYTQGGATYRVIVHADPKDYSSERLLASLGKITATETALMRDVPFSRYTFIFHFPEDAPGGGGMEHRNGTAITVRAREVHERWENLESVSAHEFFHLWNVKRLRPQLLEPIDYVHGNDTRDLWFCEGLTSTYGELALLRAGLISRKTFTPTWPIRLTSSNPGPPVSSKASRSPAWRPGSRDTTTTSVPSAASPTTTRVNCWVSCSTWRSVTPPATPPDWMM